MFIAEIFFQIIISRKVCYRSVFNFVDFQNAADSSIYEKGKKYEIRKYPLLRLLLIFFMS